LAPLAFGTITALTILWVWGSFDALPVTHDEAAYKLQAEIFASGRWAAPSPPLPEFFEQYHVLVTPALAAKYPPGHALLLSLGTLVGLPGLMPLLLSGISGALVFSLGRQITSPWVALLTWIIWLSSLSNLVWRASYFSEVTTSALWLLAWWLLLRWCTDPKRWLLVLLAAVVGWGAITRPLTMFAFFIPIAFIIVRYVYRARSWCDLGLATIAGIAMLSIIPIWSFKTTGSWTDTPLGLYTRMYMPYDYPGFGVDTTPPERKLPEDMMSFNRGFLFGHSEHVPSAIPRVLGERIATVLGEFASGWRMLLLPFALLGLLGARRELWIGLITTGLLFLSYATYAYPPGWTLYYLETLPVIAFVCASGLWNTVAYLARWLPHLFKGPIPFYCGIMALTAMVVLSSVEVFQTRLMVSHDRAYFEVFQILLESIPEEKAGVFIRYSPDHNPHQSLINNAPQIDKASRITVYDRGADNQKLIDLLPDRAWYVFDEANFRLTPLRPTQ